MVFKFLGFGCWKKHSSSSSSKTKRPYQTVIEELCIRFSLDDLRKATNNFDENNLIGRGGFVDVYKGCLLLNLIYGILTDKCDVYSFGVVLSEVVRGESLCTVMDKWRKYCQQPNEEIEMSNNGSESSDEIYVPLPSYNMLKLQAEDIDPALAGNIAPECYAAYIDIIDRCIKLDPNERPTMGEVEVLLEHALTLQQEADNARDHTSITQPQQQEALI